MTKYHRDYIVHNCFSEMERVSLLGKSNFYKILRQCLAYFRIVAVS